MTRLHHSLLLIGLLFAGALQGVEADAPPPTIKGVTINGEKIPAAYIQKIYDRLVPLYKAAGKPLPAILLNKLASESEKQAVRQVVVRQYVEQNKIVASPEAMKDELTRVKDDLAARGVAWEDFLKRQGQTEAEFMQEAATLVAFLQSFKDTLDVGKLKESFAKDKEKIPTHRVSRILFTYSRSIDSKHRERSQDQAAQLAEAALQLIRNGDDFARVAREQSDDKERMDMGWSLFDKEYKPFTEALASLGKVGDVSPVFETAYGFQIIKLTGLRTEKDVWDYYLQTAIDRKAQSVAEELNKNAKVEEEK